MENPIIRITTLSGEQVSAPLVAWVQALILRLPPGELMQLLRMVQTPQHAERSKLVLPTDLDVKPVEADPKEWSPENIRKNGVPKRY